VVIDFVDLIKRSELLPANYNVEGAHSLKSIMLCSNVIIRGVYTSDNVYDYASLPSDMRFKFSFDMNRWQEFFSWQMVPADWNKKSADLLSESQYNDL
jgi:hypothetical protein